MILVNTSTVDATYKITNGSGASITGALSGGCETVETLSPNFSYKIQFTALNQTDQVINQSSCSTISMVVTSGILSIAVGTIVLLISGPGTANQQIEIGNQRVVSLTLGDANSWTMKVLTDGKSEGSRSMSEIRMRAGRLVEVKTP